MQALLKQAQAMQAQMAEAQEKLASTELTGTAGGGLVTATVSGTGEVLALKIDVKAVDPEDVETLEDLVVAAIRDGQSQASEMGESTMGPVAGGAQGLLGGL
ncbi:MAG: nucleoid-associated protein EbfC [Frankiales bacterium]|jgi:DNA-binding YbaB/EbfC family protein|nr:nucleoid-associated protein EbfC [Frankiales bacterium]